MKQLGLLFQLLCMLIGGCMVAQTPCVNHLFAMFCPTDRSSMIKTTIETKLNERLNSAAVKSLMSVLFTQFLPSGTVVNRVTMNAAGDIIVE